MTRDHAVVLGAGMSGLFAACALGGHFDRITVVDRDCLPASPAHRKGTPQDRHPHLLLARGAQVIEQLHPGLLAELVAAGTPILRSFRDAQIDLGGHPLTRYGAPPEPMYQASRADLEGLLRSRTARAATIRHSTAAVGLIHSRGKVTGVRLDGPDGREELAADLVVDATGRSGRAAAWLPEIGYPAPDEEHVEVDVCYVSALLELPLDLPQILLVSTSPKRPRGIGAMRVGATRFLLTAYGYRGHHPSGDREGIRRAFAELAPPGWIEALEGAAWPDRVAVHRYPHSVRRRYEQLAQFPEGLLVVGDGLCSFNPLYGQGMTVAALQAVALGRALEAGDADLARRYFAAAAKHVDVAWRLSVAGDLAYPSVPGPRPFWVRPMNRAVDAILSAAETDPKVRDAFLRVSWLLDSPRSLAGPAFVARVLRRQLVTRGATSRRWIANKRYSTTPDESEPCGADVAQVTLARR